MDREEQDENAELDQVVEEASEEAEAHGISRQEVEKAKDDDGEDVSPKDGAAM